MTEGYWREIFDEEIDRQLVIVNGFVVTAAGKKRFVLDCRVPNDYIDPRRFKYESLAELAAQLRPGDRLIKWDVRDAYHHLLLREEDRQYFAFQVFGRTFQSLTMPFGLRVAPYLWTKVCRPVVQRLRALGSRVIVYVDDFWGSTTEPEGQACHQGGCQARQLGGAAAVLSAGPPASPHQGAMGGDYGAAVARPRGRHPPEAVPADARKDDEGEGHGG